MIMKYDVRACHFNMDNGCVELLLQDGRKISIGDGHCNILQIGRIDLRLVVAKFYDEQNLQSHADHQSKGTKRNLAFLFQFGRIIVLVIFEMGNNKRRITFTLR